MPNPTFFSYAIQNESIHGDGYYFTFFYKDLQILYSRNYASAKECKTARGEVYSQMRDKENMRLEKIEFHCSRSIKYKWQFVVLNKNDKVIAHSCLFPEKSATLLAMNDVITNSGVSFFEEGIFVRSDAIRSDDFIGSLDFKASPNFYLYTIPNEEKGDGHYFVLEGRIPTRNSETDFLRSQKYLNKNTRNKGVKSVIDNAGNHNNFRLERLSFFPKGIDDISSINQYQLTICAENNIAIAHSPMEANEEIVFDMANIIQMQQDSLIIWQEKKRTSHRI